MGLELKTVPSCLDDQFLLSQALPNVAPSCPHLGLKHAVAPTTFQMKPGAPLQPGGSVGAPSPLQILCLRLLPGPCSSFHVPPVKLPITHNLYYKDPYPILASSPVAS